MKNKKFLTSMLLLTSVIVLVACSSGKASPSISGSDWKLVSYGPISNQTPAAEGIDTSLKFGTDGQVSGNMGCNSFGGEYTQKDDQITFGALVSTMMACPEPQMSQEGASFAILTGSVNFTIDGDTLTIVDASGKNGLVLFRQ
jgi:heat shock protein HslJ